MPPDPHIGRYSSFPVTENTDLSDGSGAVHPAGSVIGEGPIFTHLLRKRPPGSCRGMVESALTFVTGDPRSAAQGWSALPGHESFIVTGSDLPTEKERPGGSLAAGTSSWRERPGPVNRGPVTHTV